MMLENWKIGLIIIFSLLVGGIFGFSVFSSEEKPESVEHKEFDLNYFDKTLDAKLEPIREAIIVSSADLCSSNGGLWLFNPDGNLARIDYDLLVDVNRNLIQRVPASLCIWPPTSNR